MLKASLGKKYGKDTAGFAGAIESKSTFNTTFDGQTVTVTLNHDIAFTEEGGTLNLSYKYFKIVKALMAEISRRKAEKVEGDL